MARKILQSFGSHARFRVEAAPASSREPSNVAFGLLAARFDYPDILRRPTDEVLGRFHQGGSGLVLLWWSFALSVVLFAPLVVLLAHSLDGADSALLSVGATVGVLAAAVQFLGLIRWPFQPPYLARVAADVVFQSLNRYLAFSPARRSRKARPHAHGSVSSASSLEEC